MTSGSSLLLGPLGKPKTTPSLGIAASLTPLQPVKVQYDVLKAFEVSSDTKSAREQSDRYTKTFMYAGSTAQVQRTESITTIEPMRGISLASAQITRYEQIPVVKPLQTVFPTQEIVPIESLIIPPLTGFKLPYTGTAGGGGSRGKLRYFKETFLMGLDISTYASTRYGGKRMPQFKGIPGVLRSVERASKKTKRK
jgi:hypothetical protein